MTNKSAQKSARRNGRAPGVPFARGSDSRRGRGPQKGAPNAGRPAGEFKEFCRRLLAAPKAEKELQSVLEDSRHPAYAALWRAVSDRAYGKAVQAVELAGKDGAPVIPIEFVQAALKRVRAAGLDEPPKRIAVAIDGHSGNGKH